MLKRISNLRNIGRFRDASCGSVEFRQIPIIFGRNTYGKTTLGDLLSSIESQDLGAVTGRKSIPRDDQPQAATLAFLPPNETSETAISIASGQWQPRLPGDLRLLVFDDGFYHNNIFAARQFTRTTKENFSAYVLGVQGVAKAKIISEKNREKRAATQARNRLKSDAFSHIEDLATFVALSPTTTIEEARRQVDDLRRQYDALSAQRNNSNAIRERKLCTALSWDFDFSRTLSALNETLALSLETHHEEARAKVAEHVATHFENAESAESWIRTGLLQNNGATCQFCSQALGEQAKQLLEVYRQSFDSSYEAHERLVSGQISSFQSEFQLDRSKRPRLAIEKNNAAVLSYAELGDNQQFSELRQNLAELAEAIQGELDAWDEQQPSFISRLKNAIANKQRSPHKPTDPLEDSEITGISSNVARLAADYNSTVDEINSALQVFKGSVDPDALTHRLNELELHRKTTSRILRRLELSDQVERYIAHETVIRRLGEEIPRLESELRTEQSTYLDHFFESLNHWFDEFGSHDFELERGEDSSGHTPVYFLKVKFCGETVTERELDRVLSESDRRALALSVFWSSFSNLSTDEKHKTIVILDDPVTSFDNNRITAVHQEIARMSDIVRQVVVLSHYDVEVSKFLSTYKDTKDVGLIEIKLSPNGSTIEVADIDYFVMDEHARKTSAILSFISGTISSHNAGDLRIFLEKEINQRFASKIDVLQLTGTFLGEKIDGLNRGSAISDSVASEAHDWRINLNPDHHTWNSADIEDQRRTARRFMDFVYTRLVPLG